MKILLIHNFYQQAGGEDQVFASEASMLEQAGHEVLRFTATNDSVAGMSKAGLAAATIWNRHFYREIFEIVSRERPQIAHFHNTFPLISPAGYYAARRAGAAVVQTLHNYRLICPKATLLRNGKPCEDCVGKRLPWPGVIHSCYRNNRVASAGVASMLAVHRAAGTWSRTVDAYIALTLFSREKFIAGGLPADRIHIKPNFTEPDPGKGPGGGAFLYAGRLSEEKGLNVLIAAWRSRADMPTLKIIGDGPLGPWLKDQIAAMPNVEWLGRLPRESVLEHMRNSCALVLPSIWYENFPVSVVEAYATGLPVIASDAGTLPELVRDGQTGFIFRSGDAHLLAGKVIGLHADSNLQERFREASRREYETYYQRVRNGEILLHIYRMAIESRGLANRKSPP